VTAEVGEVAGRRPTILQVARLAGVSHQTVSRYIRFDGEGMKDTTRERISAAIAELGYRPNLAAQAMRARRTGRLALLLPAGSAASSLEMLAGAMKAADEAGYLVEVITLGGSSRTRSTRVLELADSGLFDGVASLTPLPVETEVPGASRTPIVVLPDYDEEMRGIGEIADASPVVDLIERLADDGHRRFLHIAGDYAYPSARSRREVYLSTIARLGLESFGVVDTGWAPEPAIQAIRDLPEGSGVTAVIAANDQLAAAVVRGAWERGWRVPDDLSVTGWDDNPVSSIMPPSITSVAMDYEKLGRRAISHLLAVLQVTIGADGDDSIATIVWRESTGPAPVR
jgi:DNA-binding LacI/PurR family transcriptional regulator